MISNEGNSDGVPARLLAGTAAVGDLVREARDGPWRVLVAEDSMRPTLEPGDWLLVDPTIKVWPKRGTIVVIREPETEVLAIKRVVARPGDVIRTTTGPIRLSRTQAWLLGDDRAVSRDCRAYGPVELDRLVARAWFRYGPRGRTGRLERLAEPAGGRKG
jgi:mitochondrial inner membrane protease subunit 2